jgi:hypothetical protein
MQPKAGDVLFIPQSNGKYTPAYVLGLWPRSTSVMCLALLDLEFDERTNKAAAIRSRILDALARRQIIAILSTPALPAKKGEWKIVDTASGVDVSELLPAQPFKTSSLVGSKYESAPLVEGLVNAHRGLVAWDAVMPGRPGYLKSLLYPPPTVH